MNGRGAAIVAQDVRPVTWRLLVGFLCLVALAGGCSNRSGKSNRSVRRAFRTMLSKKEQYRYEMRNVTQFGKAAVPYLLDQLTNGSVVCWREHPGGHDHMGMPSPPWRELVPVCAVAAEALATIYDKADPNDPFAEQARNAIRDFVRRELTIGRIRQAVPGAADIGSSGWLIDTIGDLDCETAAMPLAAFLEQCMARDTQWHRDVGRSVVPDTLAVLARTGKPDVVTQVISYMETRPQIRYYDADFQRTLAHFIPTQLSRILAAFEHVSRQNRVIIVRALAESSDPRLTPTLLELTLGRHSGNSAILQMADAAFRGLMKITRRDNKREALLDLLQIPLDRMARRTVVDLLGDFGVPQDIHLLESLAEADDEADFRILARESIARIGERSTK